MFRLIFRFLAAAALLPLVACGPDIEQIPAYVEIEGLELASDGLPVSTDITEVWVFADDAFVGAFPLPARVPVHKADTTVLRFEAGVRQNGISSLPEIYPFYTKPTRTLILQPGTTTQLGTLTLRYRDDAQFAFVEGFEDGQDRVFTDLRRGARGFERITDGVRSGNFAGRLRLDEDNEVVELGSAEIFQDLRLSPRTASVWLEIDYRSNTSGIFGFNQQYEPGFFARDAYQKIYFNLSDLALNIEQNGLQLYFSSLLPAGQTEAEVVLDNVRLLHL